MNFIDKKQAEFEDFKSRSKLVVVKNGKYLTDGKEKRHIERSSGAIVGDNYTSYSPCAQNCPPWENCTCTKIDYSYSEDIFLALLN